MKKIFLILTVVFFVLAASLTGVWFVSYRESREPPKALVLGIPERNPNEAQDWEDIRQALFRGLTLKDEQETFQIQIPPIFLMSYHGERIPLCEEYPLLTFTFEGEGVATHGEKASFEIEWNCETDDLGNPLPIEISKSFLTSSEPSQHDEVELPAGHGILRFYSFSSENPPEWILVQIFLENRDQGYRLEWSREWLQKNSRYPFIVRSHSP